MKGGRGAFFGSNIGSSRGAFSGLRSVQSIQTMVPATSREVPLGTSLPSVELSETPILPDVSNDFSLTDSAMDIDVDVHADSALPEQVPVELLDVPVRTCALTSEAACTSATGAIDVPSQDTTSAIAGEIEPTSLRSSRTTRRRTVRARARVIPVVEPQPTAAESIGAVLLGDLNDNEEDEERDGQPQEACQEAEDLSRPSPRLATLGRDPHEIYKSSHEFWFVRFALMLVAFLHIRFNIPFRACNLALFSLNAVLLALKVFSVETSVPTTLVTLLNRLELQDRFTVFPICEVCHRFFKKGIPTDATCPDCDCPLFRASLPPLLSGILLRKAPDPLPNLCAPMQPLSSLLVEFLSRPGIEDIVETYWKQRERKTGQQLDIMDGELWQSLEGPDGKLFFDPNDQSGELRIGVTLGIDWQVLLFLFQYQISNCSV